jgi:hypothetical protein
MVDTVDRDKYILRGLECDVAMIVWCQQGYRLIGGTRTNRIFGPAVKLFGKEEVTVAYQALRGRGLIKVTTGNRRLLIDPVQFEFQDGHDYELWFRVHQMAARLRDLGELNVPCPGAGEYKAKQSGAVTTLVGELAQPRRKAGELLAAVTASDHRAVRSESPLDLLRQIKIKMGISGMITEEDRATVLARLAKIQKAINLVIDIREARRPSDLKKVK